MLTEKDCCDYELRLGLRDIGYPMSTCQINDGPIQMPKITLYEAQKWLREEKNIIVDVRYGAQYYNVVLNHTITCGYHIVKDKNNRIADFIKYEEALSEGVKCAVKLLKEKENGRM